MVDKEQNELLTVLGDLSRLRMADVFAVALCANKAIFWYEEGRGLDLSKTAEIIYALADALADEKRRREDAEAKKNQK